jgi:hypothetical protein
MLVTGYWKWSPRFRQYVWVTTTSIKKSKKGTNLLMIPSNQKKTYYRPLSDTTSF